MMIRRLKSLPPRLSAGVLAPLFSFSIGNPAWAQNVRNANTVGDILENGILLIVIAVNFILAAAAIWGLFVIFRALMQLKQQADNPQAAAQAGNPWFSLGAGMGAVALAALVAVVVNTGFGQGAADDQFDRSRVLIER